MTDEEIKQARAVIEAAHDTTLAPDERRYARLKAAEMLPAALGALEEERKRSRQRLNMVAKFEKFCDELGQALGRPDEQDHLYRRGEMLSDVVQLKAEVEQLEATIEDWRELSNDQSDREDHQRKRAEAFRKAAEAFEPLVHDCEDGVPEEHTDEMCKAGLLAHVLLHEARALDKGAGGE